MREDAQVVLKDALKDTVSGNLARFPRTGSGRTDLKAAAVAVCILAGASDSSLLITRRAPGLRAHAGQWALPGGRAEPGESAPDAARRELFEETGVGSSEASVLGLLDDYVTRSGYIMTPVVVWLDESEVTFEPSAGEVSAVHTVPLGDIDVEPTFLTIPESDRPVIQLPLLGRMIHAPTAAILYQFREVGLHGRATRVEHLEQPLFAWK
jgi:8-oxo-dGTP pyrophosphatase MutT (NUDIX family)